MAHSILFPRFCVLYYILLLHTTEAKTTEIMFHLSCDELSAFSVVGEGVGFGIQVSFVAILIAAPLIITKPWLGHVASYHRERMQWELGCLCAKSL